MDSSGHGECNLCGVSLDSTDASVGEKVVPYALDSVADPDPGSGAFLSLDPDPGSGIGFFPDPGSQPHIF